MLVSAWGLEPKGEEMAGEWLSGRLGPFGGRVGSVVPQGFAPYARVLHPPQHPRATWAEMCTLNDRTPHALMQWSKICAAVQPDNEAATRHEDRPGPPLEGNLEPLVLAASRALIAAVLATEGIEAWPVDPSDNLGYDGDRVNG